jgi:hypothetical protein
MEYKFCGNKWLFLKIESYNEKQPCQCDSGKHKGPGNGTDFFLFPKDPWLSPFGVTITIFSAFFRVWRAKESNIKHGCPSSEENAPTSRLPVKVWKGP